MRITTQQQEQLLEYIKDGTINDIKHVIDDFRIETIPYLNQQQTHLLLEAARYGKLKVIEYFIEHKLVESFDFLDSHKNTALHIICENPDQVDHPAIIELLLNHDIPLDSMNKDQFTALELACRNGNRKIVQLLVSANANVNIGLPLYYATQYGFTNIVRQLLTTKEHGEDNILGHHCIRIENNASFAPLRVCRHLPIAKLLVEDGGADLNAVDDYGESPLFQAVRKVNMDLITYYLSQGAIATLFNIHNQTLLHVLYERFNVMHSMFDFVGATKLLLKYDVKINHRDLKHQQTPIQMLQSKRDIHPSKVADMLKILDDIHEERIRSSKEMFSQYVME